MKKVKRDILQRLTDLPTTVVGSVIILFALFLVYQKIISFQDFTAFALIAFPFFFYKKEKPTKEDDTE